MVTKKLELLNEQTSPLHRIMWVHNDDEPARRVFENNICAFHIGNGVIMSVAHNLRTELQFFRTISEESFQTDILQNVHPSLRWLFDVSFVLDSQTNKRYVNIPNQDDFIKVKDEILRINYDTRWISLNQRNFCKPFLIVQFKNNQFYNDPELTELFDTNRYFHEPNIGRHTFLIEVEIINPIYSEDVTIYRIVNTDQRIIDKLPKISLDYNLYDCNSNNFCCLQASPNNSNLGRLLNDAKIEGMLDHWTDFIDYIGGNYFFEGTRYLIKGYFRFGSSGAPYVIYDNESESFKANAIQSEASGIQLDINNNREGNFQYINAIASPLLNVKTSIEQALNMK
jgi:hypothetical protein